MRINQNIAAFNAYRNLSNTQTSLSKSLEKLSSGYRINRAADDAAGLTKSELLRAEITGTNTAIRNAQDGISLIQTAEGALNEVHAILQRMRELAVQASNDTNVEFDRGALNDEFQQLKEEIGRIQNTTQFNKQTLLDGDVTSVNLQVGANADELITLDLSEVNLTAITEALENLDIEGFDNSQEAITAIESQIEAVSSGRSYLGAMQNRLEHTINNLDNAAENLTAAESRIRDVDMAKEMMEFTKNSILTQAAQAMLAQSQQTPQGVLQLLR